MLYKHSALLTHNIFVISSTAKGFANTRGTCMYVLEPFSINLATSLLLRFPKWVHSEILVCRDHCYAFLAVADLPILFGKVLLVK